LAKEKVLKNVVRPCVNSRLAVKIVDFPLCLIRRPQARWPLRAFSWLSERRSEARVYGISNGITPDRHKDESVEIVRKALDTKQGRGLRLIVHFLEDAFLYDDGYLRFMSTSNYECVDVPNENDGTVPVLVGNWPKTEEIAEWLKLHSEKAGNLSCTVGKPMVRLGAGNSMEKAGFEN
jgi:hypothetical protein